MGRAAAVRIAGQQKLSIDRRTMQRGKSVADQGHSAREAALADSAVEQWCNDGATDHADLWLAGRASMRAEVELAKVACKAASEEIKQLREVVAQAIKTVNEAQGLLRSYTTNGSEMLSGVRFAYNVNARFLAENFKFQNEYLGVKSENRIPSEAD